jgi:hypothetical protein
VIDWSGSGQIAGFTHAFVHPHQVLLGIWHVG